VSPKVLLEGPYEAGFFLPMRDELRVAGLVPLQEPYTAMGFTLEQAASIAPAILIPASSSAVVDWVLVELRSANDPASVIARRAAILKRTGNVVATDGTGPIGFCAANGNYHIAIRHRNHLGVMTAAPVALSAVPAVIDFSDAATPAWGTDARKQMGADMVLWSGNTNPDGLLKYIGDGNDRDPILARVGGSTPTATVSGYWPEDVNLDGVVKYVGQNNDRDPILVNIGGSTPTNTRQQQLP
jgi:hypothetical protein